MNRAQVINFLGIQGKVFEIGVPQNLSSDSYCDSEYRRELCRLQSRQRIGLGVWMVTRYSPLTSPDFEVTIENGENIWRVVYSPTASWTGLVVDNSQLATPVLSVLRGSRFHSWSDNQTYYPASGGHWEPKVARVFPDTVIGYRNVVRWLCAQINAEVPISNSIPIPRGLA